MPATQKIDADNRRALMEVALSSSTLPEFQGSAWEQGEDIGAQSALRYALMTPRLLAPHGNRRPASISPAQAPSADCPARARRVWPSDCEFLLRCRRHGLRVTTSFECSARRPTPAALLG